MPVNALCKRCGLENIAWCLYSNRVGRGTLCQPGKLESRGKEGCQLKSRMEPADETNGKHFSMREVASCHEGKNETESTVVGCNVVEKVSKRP